MICAAFQGMALAGGSLHCLGGPAVPWAWAAAAAVALASAWLALRAPPPRAARLAGLAGFALTAALLALAVERPVVRQALGQGEGGRILVLLDASESFWRQPETAAAALATAADRIAGFLAAVPPAEHPLWRGELRSFGRAPALLGAETTAGNLIATLRRHRVSAPEPASDLRAGLAAALAALRAEGGQRMVVLVTDALAGPPPDEALLAEFRAEGIPVHLVAAGAAVPAAGLIAADIGPEHALGQPAVLRGTVLGAGELTLTGPQPAPPPLVVPPGDRLRALRLTTAFAQRGLQGVGLGFATPAGVQGRSLFTLVRGPARVLVFGPAPWADALPPARWRIERADPAAPPAPVDYDLVVIDALAPADFAPGYAGALLAAADGTGLFLVNGGLRGGADRAQVVSDWNATPLNPILPVDSDPRLFVQEPPPRDIVIMVDVSGSMGEGVRLWSAQSAIGAILRQLRPRDTITILPFAEGSRAPFPRAPASPATLEAARRFAAGLRAGGGTAPAATIRASARFVSNYCAFFFISDNDFLPPPVAPQCFTTAISVSDKPFPADLSAWGEEILVGEGGDGSGIRLEYFEPDERKEYWREGGFLPLVADGAAELEAGIAVEGLAIAYPRVDARVELVHAAPPPDPLFAWRRDPGRPGIATGVFLGPMGAAWGQQGLGATEAMLARLLGWPDQERYLIRLGEGPQGLRLAVTPVRGDPAAPLAASLHWADGSATGIALHHDPRRGAHLGDLRLPAGAAGQRALLVLQQGADIQRIPVGFPAAPATATGGAEALGFGIDARLAAGILDLAGGRSLDRQEIPAYSSRPVERDDPLHLPLLALAFALLALSVWSRELRS